MRWLLLFALSACAAPRPIEVRDDSAPRGRAVATVSAGSSPAPSAPGSAQEVPRPEASSSGILDHEEPGLPADASELTRADADFRAKRTAESAGLFINAFMAAKQSERTVGVKQSLDDAITVELEQMAEMEAGWLSDIGLQGYCQRTSELRGLPASAANKTKIAAESKRFCSKLKKK